MGRGSILARLLLKPRIAIRGSGSSHKPLLRRPLNCRLFAPPAMRIVMLKLLMMKQRTGFLQLVDHELVGVPDQLAAEEFRHGVIVAAVGEDGVVDLEAVFHAGLVVFLAVSGRGVDEAGAIFEGDVVGEDDGAGARSIDRMSIARFFQIGTVDPCNNPGVFGIPQFKDFGGQ